MVGETFLTDSVVLVWKQKALLDRPEDVQVAVFSETSPATESERQATAHTEPLSKYQGNHSR